MGDLWKIFAKFGSLGDVYIPNKVDKWGKKFAFVKFKGVKDVDALSERLEDVWSGNFKLRVNRARFDRNDQPPHSVTPVVNRKKRGVESCEEKGSSFREALIGGKNVVAGVVSEEPVLQVEVDKLVLEELQHSFVGVLALEVEVSRIRTTFYMEGRQHISVTLMG
ncbi:RNA recognition motif, partial [Trifolium medium]|nr:RNA recognition motif [Trifolium medium]